MVRDRQGVVMDISDLKRNDPILVLWLDTNTQKENGWFGEPVSSKQGSNPRYKKVLSA